MTSVRKKLLGVVVAVFTCAAGRAGALSFTPHVSIYADDKEQALSRPEGVACADGGAVVVADTGNGRLVTYAAKGDQLTGGSEIKLAQLTFPTRVQIDSKGNLLALDGRARRIVRLDAAGTFRGYIEPKGVTGVVPGAFKLDGADNAYVLDIAARKVLVVDPDGNLTRTVPLPRKGGAFTDIAVDAAGTMFAVEAVSATVFAADKAATEFKPISQGLKEHMSFPAYITASKGKLYLVDQNGNGIVVVGQDGSYQGRQLGIGVGEGLVHYPAQLCLTGNAEAFVADRSNNRVQVFKIVQ